MSRVKGVATAAVAAAFSYAAHRTLADSGGPTRLDRWQARWDANMTRWHMHELNPLLVKYERDLLGSNESSSIVFPLCGSAVDLGVLALRGHYVLGVEGISKAVDTLLASFGTEEEPPRLHKGLKLRTAVAPGEAGSHTPTVLRAVQGDFLSVTSAAADSLGLPRFDAAFDRGSLVAIVPSDRPAYARVLTELMAPEGRVLLVTVEHDDAGGRFAGPPYEVTEAQVHELFGDAFEVKLLQREDRMAIEPVWRERGCTRFSQAAYLLTRRPSNRESLVAHLLRRSSCAGLLKRRTCAGLIRDLSPEAFMI